MHDDLIPPPFTDGDLCTAVTPGAVFTCRKKGLTIGELSVSPHHQASP